MRIRCLGTGAAEGWPALFCRCAACGRARTSGGKNVRSRTEVVVDEVFQFDLGPDAYLHVTAGHDLSQVRHLIFTHAHADHLAPEALAYRVPPFAHGVSEPLQVYGGDSVLRALRQGYPDPARAGLVLQRLEPFQPVDAGDAVLIPLLADHDPAQTCFIYLFGRGGRWLLYGHDTGYFPESTWGYLAAWACQHHRLDAALLDGTNGPEVGRRGHMGLPACAEVRARLLQLEAATVTTRWIVTHFSHNGGLLHDELVARAAPLGLEVAYDGMELWLPQA